MKIVFTKSSKSNIQSFDLTGLAMGDWCEICKDDGVTQIFICLSGFAIIFATNLILLSFYGYLSSKYLHIGCGTVLFNGPFMLFCLFKKYAPILRKWLRRSASSFQSGSLAQHVEFVNDQEVEPPTAAAKETDESSSVASKNALDMEALLEKLKLVESVQANVRKLWNLKYELQEFAAMAQEEHDTAESQPEAISENFMPSSTGGKKGRQVTRRLSASAEEEQFHDGILAIPDLRFFREMQQRLDELIKIQESRLGDPTLLRPEMVDEQILSAIAAKVYAMGPHKWVERCEDDEDDDLLVTEAMDDQTSSEPTEATPTEVAQYPSMTADDQRSNEATVTAQTSTKMAKDPSSRI